jgi:hypothetical protein
MARLAYQLLLCVSGQTLFNKGFSEGAIKEHGNLKQFFRR